jgi:PAS domain S-box-containing protein
MTHEARHTPPRDSDFVLAQAAAIIEFSDDAIISKDLHGIVLSWNKAAESLFGYTAAEMIGRPVQVLIPPERCHEEGEILTRLRKGDHIDHYETVRKRKDGTLIDISLTVSPLKDRSGRIIGASKIARDISQQKQSERRFRELVEALPTAVYTTDLEGRLTHYNQAAQNLWGCCPELDTARWCGSWRRYRSDGTEMPLDQSPMALSVGQNHAVRGVEMVIERPDGSRVPVLPFPTPLRDPAGVVIGGLNMLVDISDRKQAEEQLSRSAAESEERVAERTQELRCSQERLRALASELTLTEQRERRRLATDLHDYLAQIVVASRIKLSQTISRSRDQDLSASLLKIDEMLDQALTYTRSLVAELSPHVLYQFGLSKSLVWLGDQMKHHDLEVTVHPAPASFTLPDDHAVLLFQSVRELLFNIVKHARTDKASITVTVDAEKELWICVEDSGTGFDVTALTRPADAQTKFGLLSIRERMELLGGECEVSSSLGVGTLAILRLPLAPSCVGSTTPAVMPRYESEAAVPKSLDRCVRVLLVDDHAMVRQGLRSILDSYGDLDVVGEAADGQDAVIMARSLRPDVVVMDVNLPLVDGIEATRILRQEHQAITVIGISVRNDPQVRHAMTDAGAVDFLPKESAASRLYEVILNHCPAVKS